MGCDLRIGERPRRPAQVQRELRREVGTSVLNRCRGHEQNSRTAAERGHGGITSRRRIPNAVRFVDDHQVRLDVRRRSPAQRFVRQENRLELALAHRRGPHLAERRGRGDHDARRAQSNGNGDRGVRLADTHRLGKHRSAVVFDHRDEALGRLYLVRSQFDSNQHVRRDRRAFAEDGRRDEPSNVVGGRTSKPGHVTAHATIAAYSCRSASYAASDASSNS